VIQSLVSSWFTAPHATPPGVPSRGIFVPFLDPVRRASGSQVRTWEPDDPPSWRGPESEVKPAWFNIRAFCRQMAPVCALMRKLAKKPAENRQKSQGKGRKMALFRGSKAPFRRARSRGPSIATRQSARPYVCGVRLHQAASGPRNWRGSAILGGVPSRVTLGTSGRKPIRPFPVGSAPSSDDPALTDVPWVIAKASSVFRPRADPSGIAFMSRSL